MSKSSRRPFHKFQKRLPCLRTAKKIYRSARDWTETTSVELSEVIPLFQRDHEEIKFVAGQNYCLVKVLGRAGIQEVTVFTDAPDIIRRRLVILCRRNLSIPFHIEG